MKRWLCAMLAGLCLLLPACGNLEENLERDRNDPVPASQDPDEVWTGVSHDGVSYQINSKWETQDEQSHIYADAERSAIYAVSVTPGGAVTDGQDVLLEAIGSVRLSEDFEGFQFEYDTDDWPSLETDGGGQYQYNIVTLSSKDGSGVYVAAVVDGGATVQAMGFYAPGDDSFVRGQLDRLLRSLSITEEAHTAAPEQMQQVGTAEFGYVTVPGDWGPFLDLDGGDDFQYADPEGRCIITLNVFSDEGLTEEQKAQVTAELAAQSLWYNLEQNGVEEIQGARVTLNGIEAFQVYGLFVSEDYGEASMIVCWTFMDEDGVIHYVSAEAPAELALETVAYVESSYVLAAEDTDN